MEASAETDSRQANVSGKGLNPAAPKPPQGPKKAPTKPPQGPKKAPPKPKTTPTKAAVKIGAKAAAAKKAPKAKEVVGAMGGEAEEAEPRSQESPPVDESRASLPKPLQPPTGVLPTATQSRPAGGAREELPQPQLPTKEDNRLLSLPTDSTLLSQEGDGEPAPKRAKPIPEATSTRSEVGILPKETQELEISPQMRLIISEAIAQGIAAGIQQNNNLHQEPSVASDTSRDSPVLQKPGCSASSIHSTESLCNYDEQKELMLSLDEGGVPERPAFTGLFNPDLFKTLLYNAKATAGKGADPAASDVSLGLSDPNSQVFSAVPNEKEEIPTPKFFLDHIQQQWDKPGANPPTNEMDRQFYNMDPNFRPALEIPTVDGPVVALASPNLLSNNRGAYLNAENNRAEVTFRKVHYAAAWAVKSSLSASFFNRTSLLWLKEMQARIPATDDRTHQDLKKLVAAAEFSADATLNSAKFASGTIASTVVARRLMWLYHWQADTKYKWKLASAPFKGEKLFGEALEPLLIETKDKGKVLPPMSRNNYWQPTPYFQKPSLGTAGSAYNFTQPHAGYFQQKRGQFKNPGYRGRGRQQFQPNWP